jgi:hypothetical protein
MKIREVKNSGSKIDKLIAFLDAQPPDEVFTNSEIMTRLGCEFDFSHRFRWGNNKWKDYMTKVLLRGNTVPVWGNKKAIINLRNELGSR